MKIKNILIIIIIALLPFCINFDLSFANVYPTYLKASVAPVASQKHRGESRL